MSIGIRNKYNFRLEYVTTAKPEASEFITSI